MSAVRFSAVCVAPYRRLPSRCSLSRLCFELIKTARFSDSVPPRSAPRSPSRHTVMLAVRHVSSSSCALSAHRHPPRLAHASRPSGRRSLTPRLTDTQDGEKNGGADNCLTGSCYMISCGVICLAFLLYITHFCYISRILVIYRAFLLYLGHSCYISSVPIICLAFLLYVRRSCYISHPILRAVPLPALVRCV